MTFLFLYEVVYNPPPPKDALKMLYAVLVAFTRTMSRNIGVINRAQLFLDSKLLSLLYNLLDIPNFPA